MNWNIIKQFVLKDINNIPFQNSLQILNFPEDLQPFSSMDIPYSFQGFLKVIQTDRNSRKIFIMLMFNFTFTFIEFTYGILGNSLSLISDSAHMLFDSTALGIGLYASFMAKLKPDSSYTYGYARFQVLSGFINGIFLMFVAFTIFNEALERIIEPPVVNSRQIIFVSVIGFCINIVGLCFFHEHSHLESEKVDDSHEHKHDHLNKDKNEHKNKNEDEHEHKHHENEHIYINENKDKHNYQYECENENEGHNHKCEHKHENQIEVDKTIDHRHHDHDLKHVHKYAIYAEEPLNEHKCEHDDHHHDHIDSDEEEEHEDHLHLHGHDHHHNENLYGKNTNKQNI